MTLQEVEVWVAQAEMQAAEQKALVEQLERDGPAWLAPVARTTLAQLRRIALRRADEMVRMRAGLVTGASLL
ncbi:hypothetical protein [Muricoccus radiodurans]|uniref:hypothetical protein n=1 Tax=Muricoccus radiodurans TaxID=2231721 RepID=UPI003CF4D419